MQVGIESFECLSCWALLLVISELLGMLVFKNKCGVSGCVCLRSEGAQSFVWWGSGTDYIFFNVYFRNTKWLWDPFKSRFKNTFKQKYALNFMI